MCKLGSNLIYAVYLKELTELQTDMRGFSVSNFPGCSATGGGCQPQNDPTVVDEFGELLANNKDGYGSNTNKSV
jgi:hypothetical protein